MSEKQRPYPDIVHVAARVLQNPQTATQWDAQRMAARILDDERNDPDPHRPTRRKRRTAR
jgi:hypothetical protein